MGSRHSGGFLVDAAVGGAWLLHLEGQEPLRGGKGGFEGKVTVGFNREHFHSDVQQKGNHWFAEMGETLVESTGSPGPSEYGKRDPKVLRSGALT